MSAHANAETHAAGTGKTFAWVWFWLILITAVEVFLAYMHIRPELMLTILVGLSTIKVAMIMAYFMHLRWEKLSLVLWLIPAMVFCICMILIFFFPDGFRMEKQRKEHVPGSHYVAPGARSQQLVS
ncbi:MAG TPA: cytochrome C oxidase subunit IV family protein [Candidatus Acidoferrales bacterium]|nr:cytochrome C oxidase subunit IV family protein [Candidatus Acidoferrales bacterium]